MCGYGFMGWGSLNVFKGRFVCLNVKVCWCGGDCVLGD